MAKYGKSWGSVSTNFTRTTGFTSETQRISKSAEDQYRKEKDQLSSMKEVASFESRQARTSASMADKAAAHELQALSKFSGKLNTFLQGTAAEWYKERDAKDLQNKIQDYKTNRTKWNEKKVELEDAMKGIAKNDEKYAKLEQDLKDHNLLDPNSEKNISKLSGNEKIAYYSVTAAQQVENTEGKYYNWVDGKGEEEVIATWLPKEEYTDEFGKKHERHPRRKINQITEPAGKQWLKDKFLREQLEANPMGGLKSDYRALLLGEPMDAALDKIQATEVQNYRQDQNEQKWDSNLQKVTNRIEGIPPFDNDTDLAGEFNAALASTGTTYVGTGKGSRQDGIDKLFEALKGSVTNQTDPEKMQKAHDRLMALGDKPVTTGPCSAKKLTVKQCFEKSGRWDETKMTAAFHKALGSIKDKNDVQLSGQAAADVEALDNKISGMLSRNTNKLTPEQAKVEAEKGWDALEEKYKNNSIALVKLAELKGKSTIGFTEADWEAKWVDIGAIHRGIIPKSELAGMPQELVNKFTDQYGWPVQSYVPGRKNSTESGLHDGYVGPKGTLAVALREVEKANLQTNPNTDSAVMVDFAGDKFQELVNRYVLNGDENGNKLSGRDAMQKANMQILAMIRNPNEILDNGEPNPFWASMPSSADKGPANAWAKNKFTDRHQMRGERLYGKNEEEIAQEILYPAQSKINTITNAGNKVEPSKHYLFPALPIVMEEGKSTHRIKDMDSLKILSDPPDPKVLFAYNRLSRKNVKNYGDFVHKQRIAILRQTSPSGNPEQSTLFADNPDLMLKWFPPGSEMRANRQGEEAYLQAENILQPGFQDDARGVQEDYGNTRGIFGNRPTLTDKQAQDYTSGRGIEWTTDD